jgi:hypothetical protein
VTAPANPIDAATIELADFAHRYGLTLSQDARRAETNARGMVVTLSICPCEGSALQAFYIESHADRTSNVASSFVIGLRCDPAFAKNLGISTGDLPFDRAFIVSPTGAKPDRRWIRKRVSREVRALLLSTATHFTHVRVGDGEAHLHWKTSVRDARSDQQRFQYVVETTFALAAAFDSGPYPINPYR